MKWFAVPGFGGTYEVDCLGNIRRTRGKGKRTTTPRVNDKGAVVVRLTDETGKRKEYFVSHIVASVFLKPGPPGAVLYHKNEKKTENFADNLAWVDKIKLGRMTGAQSRSKAVIKVDGLGNVAAIYSSAREAGRENFMSYQTIMDKCNGVTKKPMCSDGYRYIWDKKKPEKKSDGVNYRYVVPQGQWSIAQKFFSIVGAARNHTEVTGQRAEINFKRMRDLL